MEEDDELDMDSALDDKGFLPPGSYYFDTQYTTTFIMMFIVIAMLLSLVAFLISVIIKKRIQAQPKPRFRKRDKVMFYGRKMLRKVKSISGPVYTVQRKMRKRKGYMNLAKTIKGILQHTESDRKPMLQVKEPPPAILEADFRVLQLPPEFRIPTEVLYMLKNIRVFGHFERPLFLELSRSVESKFLPAGAYLFQRGQPDDSIFVVQCGRLVVYITEPDGSEYEVKEVAQGDSVHSLLSVLDVITGYSAPYKTVSCKAAEDTTVLRLPALAFQAVFKQYPESMVRVVQMMMIRLQRVTFLTLQDLLGLDAELINPDNISSKSLAIHAMNSKAGSPTKRQTSVISTPTTTAGASSSVHSTSSAETVLRVSMAEEATDVFKSAEESDGDLRQRGRSGSVTTPSGRVLGPISNWRRATSLDVDDTGRLSMSTSDFEAAAGRARVTGLDDTKPLRQISLENAAAASSKFGGGRKRAMSLEGVSERSSEEKKDYSEDEILEMAKRDLMTLFGLPDTSLLDHQIALSHIPGGSVVVKEGDQETNLMFLLKGSFLMLQTDEISGKERTVFVVSHGEMIGELAVLTGEPALFTVKARQDCCVIAISKTRFYSIMREYPQVVLKVGHQVVKKLSSFVRQTDFALHWMQLEAGEMEIERKKSIMREYPQVVLKVGHQVVKKLSSFVRQTDFALDWMQLEAGKAVYRQGDQSQCTYIVLNGRLRSVVQLPSGKKELMGEFGRGEIVGIVEVLTLKERVTTVHAIRDTELAKLPTGMLNLIKRKFPHTVTRLIEILGQRLLGQVEEKMGSTKLTAEERRTTVENLSTVALIPGSDDVPLARFALELTHSLSAVGSVLRLTKEHILQTLGGSALDSVHEYRLTSWLGQQEDLHNIVLYQADKRMTAWTQRCIRQADCILIVALADRDPNNVSEMETQLEALAVRAQKELILLHREKDGIYKPPSGTAEWLNARGWCVSHHHIRCPKRMFSKRSPARVRETYDRLFDTKADTMSDFSRLARFLTGTSIGLVLGGGGARGISQLGIIKAMEEYGIPIDIVGGVSIGALISALYAEDVNSTIMDKRLQGFCKDFGSLWKRVIDLTYPATAMFTGHNFNKSISDLFGDKQIEDLWLPYFTISTDITKYALRLHTSGSLWRYVRASMSLSGYLPPLCDPKDGHLLLDGGYVNNLPADIMRAMGVPTIIAIDVGSEDTSSITNYGDELSGWWLLWKKWNPWTEAVRVPSLDEIQSRLAYVSSMKMLDEVKNSSYCEYMRPPINNFATLAFHRHREIMEVGYHYGMTVFSGWKKSGYLQALLSEKSSTLHKRGKPGLPNMHPRFTDLAALVTRMEPQKQAIPDPDEVDYARVEGTGDTDVGMETDGIGTESASEMNPSSDVTNATNSETVTRSASAPSTVIGSEISSEDASEDASEDEVEVELDASGSTHSSIRKKVEGLRQRRHRSESSPSE